METLIVHITEKRWQHLVDQGYKLINASCGVHIAWTPDTAIHFIEEDHAPCYQCGNAMRTSVQVETPAELETLKYKFLNGPFPTITIYLNGTDFSWAANNYLLNHIDEVKERSDYMTVRVVINRLKVDRHLVRVHAKAITWPQEAE